MGMFDSLYITCQCEEQIEFQSKADKCLLNSYSLHDVPKSIAGDLDGQIERCPKCGRSYQIVVHMMVQAILYSGPDKDD